MSIPRVIGFALVATAFLTLPGLAQEKKIKRSDLPPAVEQAVAAHSQGATIRGFSEEKENGQTFYEAELMVNGHSKDVLMDANGQIVEVEEQVAVDLLSPAVRDGLQSKVGKGKLLKVESITKNGQLVAYEAKVVTDGKGRRYRSAPMGNVLITKNERPRSRPVRLSRSSVGLTPLRGRDWRPTQNETSLVAEPSRKASHGLSIRLSC